MTLQIHTSVWKILPLAGNSSPQCLPWRTAAVEVGYVLNCMKKILRDIRVCARKNRRAWMRREGSGFTRFAGSGRKWRRNGGAPVTFSSSLGTRFAGEEEGKRGGARGYL